jgi:hypothetical protein
MWILAIIEQKIKEKKLSKKDLIPTVKKMFNTNYV